MTKWEGRPHWEYGGVYLGHDDHGEWLGFPVSTLYSRPGMEFVATFGGVVLVPAAGAAHLAAFNDTHAKAAIYVDMATPPTWDRSTLRAIDLDLDVVKLQDGTVYVDDEDEFAEHTLEYGYPAEVVAMAEASAREVFAAVRTGAPPYDGTAERWLRELDVIGAGAGRRSPPAAPSP